MPTARVNRFGDRFDLAARLDIQRERNAVPHIDIRNASLGMKQCGKCKARKSTKGGRNINHKFFCSDCKGSI